MNPRLTSVVALLLPSCFAFAEQNNSIEHIEVRSSLRAVSLNQIPTSVSLVDAQALQNEQASHLQDVLNNLANINFANGSSRPRYFQIRGVGETDNYQGAPNSSVGFIIDDIDLSGLGMTSDLYDLQQLEVLRGPQGTRFGANALAGLFYLKSKDPTASPEHGLQVKLGNDNLRTFSGYSSAAVTDNLLYRVALTKHDQNGFMKNTYLNREDTNKRDELTLRGKLSYILSDDTQMDLAVIHGRFDNGYDVWTLDNNGRETRTDQPGFDNQFTTGASFKVTSELSEAMTFTSITSGSDSDHRHAYDGDWSNPDDWAAKPCPVYDDSWTEVVGTGPCQYDYWWDKQANRKVLSQEFRLNSSEAGKIFNGSSDWVVGVYAKNLAEHNDLDSTYNGWPDQVLQSEYESTSYSVFGQLDSNLSNGYELSLGLRLERRNADYKDSNNEAFNPSENMWGGHLSLSKALDQYHNAYIRIAKGYKAGGFNMGLPAELTDKKQFKAEDLYNYEFGLKSNWLEGDAYTQFTLFYMDRQNQQVQASQQDPANPQRFILYTSNAASSTNYGLELEANYQITDSLSTYGSLGLLKATYDDYKYKDKYGALVDLSGRTLAHAPETSYALGANYRNDNGIFINVNLNGKSEFYYSDSHDSKSSPYTVINAQVGYEQGSWAVYLWTKNALDERYGTRGFYFGNDPSDGWTAHQYIRYGDPRQVGVTFNYNFM
ncbi:TonB-dependent receptor [Paraferrimonas sp. SM1919]|uniref:TonB-dependent receptor n=1 Tax=Paraferrimonas sp. SM1919 TaxID=2662263 RepID=UPI0013D473F8|nr:TonB-dependent receptor [Paraferrimonas sp. SM1919]